jgi:PmbA protein
VEKLLKMAGRVSDGAEVFSLDYRSDGISFENAQMKDIDSSMQSGVSLRILKNEIQGFAYTQNLKNREELIQNALDSLKGGVEGLFEFPQTVGSNFLNTYESSIETLTNSELAEECREVCQLLSQKTKGQINVSARRSIIALRIMNSSGTDLSAKFSGYSLSTHIVYPYTSASLHRTLRKKKFEKAGDEYLTFLADIYNRSEEEVVSEQKKLKVLFLPETVYVLMWRIQNATSGQSIYQNISPVVKKIGEKIFDEKLTVYNDPMNDAIPGARSFDDEGTSCTAFPLVDKGVLKKFYYDLYFARKMKAPPTGNGFRGAISGKPAPALAHLSMTRGDKTFDEIIQSIDRGIIVAGALGAHSGNIPNGDFSIGVSPALYVEDGEIIGHVKDVMVAGNIYDILRDVAGIEDTIHFASGGNFPAILFDNINVTIKR